MQLTTNFFLSEFSCHDAANTPVPSKYLNNVKELANNLQILRDYLGEPIHINSGYRTPEYNASLDGSATKSQHLTASASDIVVKSKSPKQLNAIIEKLIKEGKMKQGGLGLYKTFTHYDIRGTKSRWDLS